MNPAESVQLPFRRHSAPTHFGSTLGGGLEGACRPIASAESGHMEAKFSICSGELRPTGKLALAESLSGVHTTM
jgi:hypothetical protein